MNVSYKKLKRWAGIFLATALLLPTAMLLMLYIAPIQQIAKRQVTQWLTTLTGVEIQVKSVHIHFPLRVEFQRVSIGTLFSVEQFTTNIHLRPLIHGSIEADYIEATNIRLYTETKTGLTQIGGSAERFRANDISYKWNERKVDIHDILLAKSYISIHDSVSSSSRSDFPRQLPIAFAISKLQLHHVATDYANTKALLKAAADNIILHDIAAESTMQLSLMQLNVQNGSLSFQPKGNRPLMCTKLSAQADSLYYTHQSLLGKLTHLEFTESHGLQMQKGKINFAWKDQALSLPHIELQTVHSNLYGHLYLSPHSTSQVSIDGDLKARIGYTDMVEWSKSIGNKAEQFANLYPNEALSISIAINGSEEQLHIRQCNITLPTAFDVALNGVAYHITAPLQREALCNWSIHTYNINFLNAFINLDTAQRLNLPYGMSYQGRSRYALDTLHTQCALTLNQGTAIIEGGYRSSNKTYTLAIETDSLDLHAILPNSKLGKVSLQSNLLGHGTDYKQEKTSIYGDIQLHSLEWGEQTLSNASAQISINSRTLHAQASCHDSLMQWNLTTVVRYAPDKLDAQLYASLNNINMTALGLSRTDIRPAFQCHATLTIDSTHTYTLSSRFSDIRLSTSTQSMAPQPFDLQGKMATDTIQIDITSGDLTFSASAHTEGSPWQWQSPILLMREGHTNNLDLHVVLSAGIDNPVNNYLALMGINIQALNATINNQAGGIIGNLTLDSVSTQEIQTGRMVFSACYTPNSLHANIQTEELTWRTPQLSLQGIAYGTLVWEFPFTPSKLSGILHLATMHFSMPAYSLFLHATDTLSITIENGKLHVKDLPLYATGKQPLILSGNISFLGHTPIANLQLSAHNVNLIQATSTNETILYGKALVRANVAMSGPFNALVITGDLLLSNNSSIHYTYKDAILTANNQLDNIITFVNFNTTTPHPKKRTPTSSVTINVNISIAPTAQLEVLLGASRQNYITLQGGGLLNLQYSPTNGIRLSGRYTIMNGELNMNVPLLHVSHMSIRSGSAINWSGNPRNPQFNILAEERIRTSVTLDNTPQSILFVAGISITDTMEKLGIQFTLSAPESASMQNMLAALPPEERSKLSVALLTTGLYLGEGGTGNLMNTALMGILQSQLDNISRDAFRTIDVSVGINPLPDGVSGISTRTGYSFSLAKRLWNDRIRIIIGGSVTTSNERIEDNAVIDNISIEWHITPNGNQYLRFFYDKNFESILEGEIRETGIGYAYRRQYWKIRR